MSFHKRLLVASTIICMNGLQVAFAAGDLVPAQASASPNTYPQHQLKNDQLKSAFPKHSKTSDNKARASFKPFIAKQILVHEAKSEDITKFGLSQYIRY